jgi:NADH-quinone oxidoreductase subunit L
MSVAVWLGARPGFRRVSGWALAGLGFDRFYNAAFVRPFLRLACGGRDDVIERAFSGWAWLAGTASSLLARTQSGRLRYYLATAVFGVVAFVALGLLR